MTLREVPVHTTVKVVKINGEGAFRRRIMDMGITKNSEIYTHISYLTHIFWNLSLHFILTFLSLLFNFPGIALNIAQGNREILSISVR